jgi:pimeloyl-ACP methyl ester carboxylesterase
MTNRVPLILVPGLLCDDALWRHQVEGLADIADIRVAHQHTRYDSMAEIADAILNDAPPRFALAGLSMGGYIAMELIDRAPDRVERLALLDTRAGEDLPEQVSQKYEFIEQVKAGGFEEVVDRLVSLFVHPDRFSDNTLIYQVKAMTHRVGPESFIRQQHALLSRRDHLANLPNISCPTTIICGRQDQLTPLELSIEMADNIPGSDLAVIENCGHLTTMERPEEVNDTMRKWLGESR